MKKREMISYAIVSILIVILIIPAVRAYFIYHHLPKCFYLLSISFACAYVITPLMMSTALRFNLLDRPRGRKKHEVATPLLGGISIYIAFIITVRINDYFSPELKGVLIASSLIFLLGLVDDFRGLSSRIKILVQLAAVAVLISFGVRISFLPSGLWGNIFEWILTAFWVIGITNAVNFLDGLDGLATGMTAISALFFGLVAFQTDYIREKQYFMMFLAFSLVGSCLGFLPHNFRRDEQARIFLGDAGSFFLGFVLAALAMMGNWAKDQTVALVIPVIILGLPIFDTSLITIMRIKDGKVKNLREWLDYTGWDHFHHRLVDLGVGKRGAVLVVYFISIWLGLNALILKNAENLQAYYALIQVGIVFILFAAFMIYGNEKGHQKEIDQEK